VHAIFDTGRGFLICTTQRGSVNGDPVLVGDHLSPRAMYFEA
jgi:hypothetical protein